MIIMNRTSWIITIFCLFLISSAFVGQRYSNLINIDISNQSHFFNDTLSHSVYIPEQHTIMKLEGYFICYFYKRNTDYFNFNLIFVPSNKFTIPLVQNIVNKSLVVNKGKPLLENYYLSGDNIKEFENIFKFSWVVKHYRSSDYDTLTSLYNKSNINILVSEYHQFHESRIQSKRPSSLQDSIGLIYKLLPIEGVFVIESYNYSSQMSHYDKMYANSDYSKERKAIYVHIYGDMRFCRLDYRFISPIFSQVIAIEFKDRKWRRFVNQRYKTN